MEGSRFTRTAATTRSLALLGVAALCVPGCAGRWRSSADRDAASILDAKHRAVRAERDAAFVSPRPPAEDEGAAGPPAGTDREPPLEVPPVLGLRDALRIATLANRNYTSRVESLYLSALGLAGTRFQFGPQFDSTLSYLATDGDTHRRRYTAGLDASASQILPTGGTVSVSGSADGTRDSEIDGDIDQGHSATATLSQPLLRGAGWEASHEALTAAERQVVYDVREFARFREQFLIDVTRDFYNLVRQAEVVGNTETRYENAVYQFKRTTALFEVGRQQKIEVLRAESEMLQVEIALIDARDSYNLAIDQFKVFLGLPTTVEFELETDPPPFEPVAVDLNSAIEAALANRFDLANAREQLEDTERALRLARNNMLPDLSLTASATRSSTRTPASNGRDISSSLGLSLEIPLQRTLERNALRRAQIALDRARRDFERFRDDIVVEVRETLRSLRQAEATMRIQERTIALEERRLRKAQIDFEAGDIGNRDVLEAQRSLLDARNERVRQLVDYEIARIRLERVMGSLEIEEDGTWRARRDPVPAVLDGDDGQGENE